MLWKREGLTETPDIPEIITIVRLCIRSHTARIVNDYIAEVVFRFIEWPACTHYLSPIDYLWNELKGRILNEICASTSMAEIIIVAAE